MSVIDREQYFTSLPQRYYVSEEQFEQDVDRIWRRQWLYAGHVSQAPSPGDYFTFEFLNDSVIIVRATNDEIRAYYNTCRHRGTRLCNGNGHAQRIVCPYHSWTYDLDGRLLNASQQEGELTMDYEALGLIEVQVSVWHGLIFVNFSPDRLPVVDDIVEPEATAEMARLEPEQMKIAHRRTYPTAANWKLLLENGVECYHCPTVHPRFCGVLDSGGMTGYYADDYTPRLIQELVLPVQYGKDTLSFDGELVSRKLLGEFGRGAAIPPDYSGSGFMTQPGYSWGDFHPDHAMIANCFPIDATHSKFDVTWLVHQDAVEGVDYDVERVIELWDVTHREDAAMLERQQAGIQSSVYTPGPNSSFAEPGIKTGLELYLKMLGDAA